MRYLIAMSRSLAVLLPLIVLSATSWAATISGTVTNSSGKSGRIYVAVLDTGSSATGYGTSLPSTGGAFTIEGVPNNMQFYVAAFVDTTNTGMRHSNDPLEVSDLFATGTGTTSIGTLSPTIPSPGEAPVAPTSARAFAGSGGTLVVWEGPTDDYGAPIAEKYNIYWSTNGSTVAGSKLNVAPGDQGFWVHNGGSYNYYRIEAVVEGRGSAWTEWIPRTVSSGVSVSGTINITGATPTAPLYVALVDFSGDIPKFHVAAVTTSGNTRNYTISGVAPGTYGIFPFVDVNGTGTRDFGDIMWPNFKTAPVVTVGTGNVTAPTVTLTAQNSLALVATTHYKGESSEGYGLGFNVEGMLKKVAKVRVTAGPNITTPIDVGIDEWGEFDLWLGIHGVPVVGQQYTFNVTYEDGSSDTFNPQITAVLSGLPTPTAPLGTVPYGTGDAAGKPTFSWTAPNPAPSTTYDYSLWVDGNDAHWDTDQDLPSSQLSIIYNADGYAYPSILTANQTYNWGISVTDANGNRAEQYASFKPITNTPQITSFTPAYAASGSSLVINGSYFMAKNTDNTVRIGGVVATVTDASENQLTVTVPEGAASGTISVTTANGTATSSASFTRQHNLSVSLLGTGSGSVTGNPTGISCISGSSNGCSALYNSGANVTLTPSEQSGSLFAGWSGCTSVVGNDCNVTMNSNKSATATFTASPLVKIGTTGYGTLQAAYNAAIDGSVIKAKEHTFIEDLLLYRDDISVTLEGGYDSLYFDNPKYTEIDGTLIIEKGDATIENIIIR